MSNICSLSFHDSVKVSAWDLRWVFDVIQWISERIIAHIHIYLIILIEDFHNFVLVIAWLVVGKFLKLLRFFGLLNCGGGVQRFIWHCGSSIWQLNLLMKMRNLWDFLRYGLLLLVHPRLNIIIKSKYLFNIWVQW